MAEWVGDCGCPGVCAEEPGWGPKEKVQELGHTCQRTVGGGPGTRQHYSHRTRCVLSACCMHGLCRVPSGIECVSWGHWPSGWPSLGGELTPGFCAGSAGLWVCRAGRDPQALTDQVAPVPPPPAAPPVPQLGLEATVRSSPAPQLPFSARPTPLAWSLSSLTLCLAHSPPLAPISTICATHMAVRGPPSPPVTHTGTQQLHVQPDPEALKIQNQEFPLWLSGLRPD